MAGMAVSSRVVVRIGLSYRGRSKHSVNRHMPYCQTVWYDKDKEHFNHDSPGGLQRMKADIYEAGHRMPFIVRWPEVVDHGTVTNQTISFTDLMATFTDILNMKLPENAGEDSFSFYPLLTGVHSEEVIPINDFS